MAMIAEYDWESDTLPHHPVRSAFRQAVAEVAAKAKAKLPAAVNGRVEAAVKLVLAGDVLFCDDGTIEVSSSDDPLKIYHLQGTACECQDYPRAPAGWCKHVRFVHPKLAL
jgi:hypothetical protein